MSNILKIDNKVIEDIKKLLTVSRQNLQQSVNNAMVQIFYIDLVFYNFKLKCFMLIDLKLGKLTHQDVGQMDTYVRVYDKFHKETNDNPTIGLILCSEDSQAVAKYSVLSASKQLFSAKYLAFLPTEKELRAELIRERGLLND